MSETRQILQEFCKDRKIINTHCHHRPEEFQSGIGLDDLLRNTYVSWCGIDLIRLRKVKESTFGWFDSTLISLGRNCAEELCEIPLELPEKTWTLLTNKIREIKRKTII